jgi:hypothetical protein
MAEDGLTFADLQTHLAIQLGVAYYGVGGAEVAQPPTDTPTLQRVKDLVNGGIRMFLNDAPPEGWNFLHPTASVNLWSTASRLTSGAPDYSAEDEQSTITASGDIFYDEMAGHSVSFVAAWVTTHLYTADDLVVYDSVTYKCLITHTSGIFQTDLNALKWAVTTSTAHTYPIVSVTSATVAVVTGDASGEGNGATFYMYTDGNFTLPSTFGGEYSGQITYAAGTCVGITLAWEAEGSIRRLRENIKRQTGYPMRAAVRKMRSLPYRWELLTYPHPTKLLVAEFPYELYFTALDDDDDAHPAGKMYDEAILAACEAYAELHGEDMMAGRSQYYEQKVLPGAYRRNNRSAPKRAGNLLMRPVPIEQSNDWRDFIRRPDARMP